MGLFRRKRSGPPTPEELLAEGRENQPLSAGDGATSDFRMVVEDVFSITGRGVVVTGTVTEGTVTVGSMIEVSRNGTAVRTFSVKGIEMFRKARKQVGPGESVGLLLADAEHHELQSGDVVTCPQPGGSAAAASPS